MGERQHGIGESQRATQWNIGMKYESEFLYSPCPCGSGKKFKFCCYKKIREGKTPPIIQDLDEGERHVQRAMHLMEQDRIQEAILEFRKAIRAADAIFSPYNNLSILLFLQGEVDEAIEIQLKSFETCVGENLYGRANLAAMYFIVGNQLKAELHLEQALTTPGVNPDHWTKLLETLARFRRHQDIVDVSNRNLGLQSPMTHFLRGVAMANLGRTSEARTELAAIRPREPRAEMAKQYLKWITAGHGPQTLEGDWPYFHPLEIMPHEVSEYLMSDAATESPHGCVYWYDNPVAVDMVAALLNEPGTCKKETVHQLSAMDHPRRS
jgi:tetratricopeptide (TPR) repeat protein